MLLLFLSALPQIRLKSPATNTGKEDREMAVSNSIRNAGERP
jgi:hypothetical protein